MYHIDAKTTYGQVSQHTLDQFGAYLYFLGYEEEGDSHHNYIQRIIGEEQFQHFISALWQCGHVAETEESDHVTCQKHGDTD